jgi:hypothetical protein
MHVESIARGLIAAPMRRVGNVTLRLNSQRLVSSHCGELARAPLSARGLRRSAARGNGGPDMGELAQLGRNDFDFAYHY